MLLQHLTTLACGPGFEPQRTLEAIRGTSVTRSSGMRTGSGVCAFYGGDCLGAYPRHRKLEHDEHAAMWFAEGVARLHRLNIGTITSARPLVRFVRGVVLGHVEETFISQLKPRMCSSSGAVEFVRLREMTAT